MSGPADTRHRPFGLPEPFGLYDPARDHDACGVGLYANIRNDKSHAISSRACESCETSSIAAPSAPIPRRATAAGVLIQIPHGFLAAEAQRLGFALPEPRRLWRRLSCSCRASRSCARRSSASGGRPPARRGSRFWAGAMSRSMIRCLGVERQEVGAVLTASCSSAAARRSATRRISSASSSSAARWCPTA